MSPRRPSAAVGRGTSARAAGGRAKVGRGTASSRGRTAVQPVGPPAELGTPATLVAMLSGGAPEAGVAIEPTVADPAQVLACERLLAAGVSAGAVRSLMRRWTCWAALVDWLPLRSSWTDEDVAALASMPGLGLEIEEMGEWVRLGPLQAGVRLTLLGILPDRLRPFPLDGKHGSDAFLKMLQVSVGTGIHKDDLLWWHTAGVLSLSRPYLNQQLWTRWRSVGATAIGLRSAALAAAAGLSPEAAVQAVAAGEVDEAAWRMLASLRAGQHL